MMRLIQMVLLLTGLLMVAAPGACTRKDDRGKPEAEKRTRTIGGWLTAAAVIWMITEVLRIFKLFWVFLIGIPIFVRILTKKCTLLLSMVSVMCNFR